MITRIKTQENSRNQSQEIQKTQEGKRGLSPDGGTKHSYAYITRREAIPGKLSHSDEPRLHRRARRPQVATPKHFEETSHHACLNLKGDRNRSKKV